MGLLGANPLSIPLLLPLLLVIIVAGTCAAQDRVDAVTVVADVQSELAARPDGIDALPIEPVIEAFPIEPVIDALPIEPVIDALPIEPPSECAALSMKNNSIDLKFPSKCCHFNTKECYNKHNGHCKRQWEAGGCDYTVDVCPHHGNNWFCTCCASCDGPNAHNECKSNGGSCRRCCYKNEYIAWWQKCSSQNCRCCKKYCMQKTCANGQGICKHSSEKCPRGYYTSRKSHCKGFGCKCCVRCNNDLHCWKIGGFCEGWEKKCPIGYKDERCHCNQRDCRCCSRRWIKPAEEAKDRALVADEADGGSSGPIGGAIRIKQSHVMEINMPQGGSGANEAVAVSEEEAQRGQEALAAEVEAMEKEEEEEEESP